jgi:hypothetical protein
MQIKYEYEKIKENIHTSQKQNKKLKEQIFELKKHISSLNEKIQLKTYSSHATYAKIKSNVVNNNKKFNLKK